MVFIGRESRHNVVWVQLGMSVLSQYSGRPMMADCAPQPVPDTSHSRKTTLCHDPAFEGLSLPQAPPPQPRRGPTPICLFTIQLSWVYRYDDDSGNQLMLQVTTIQRVVAL